MNRSLFFVLCSLLLLSCKPGPDKPKEDDPELKAALEDALKQDRPVLYDIKVLPGSMTPGYESWWRVGVAEVSEQPRVQAAYESLVEHVRETRKF